MKDVCWLCWSQPCLQKRSFQHAPNRLGRGFHDRVQPTKLLGLLLGISPNPSQGQRSNQNSFITPFKSFCYTTMHVGVLYRVIAGHWVRPNKSRYDHVPSSGKRLRNQVRHTRYCPTAPGWRGGTTNLKELNLGTIRTSPCITPQWSWVGRISPPVNST
jgi:hypothetical protein